LVFVNYIPHDNFHVLQALWFSLITSWLVSIKDKVRYWLNLFWIAALTSGSLWWVIGSYINSELDWIALGYFLLTWTVFIFYLKILPNYLKKVTIVAEVK
jgi:ABC-type multidrug transport system permease subunit